MNFERGLHRLAKVAGLLLAGWVFLVCEAFGITAVFTYERTSELYLGVALIVIGVVGAVASYYLIG
ncbi:MAG TPA: hypothetical protein QGF95_02140, partial [Candidatus Latescibacteria bacterium]|nr:hypothetical protein [Candidatus Latescibacterota bacterium]